jgi:redox-sensitive bicupin YhaK (pirin superfamily)
MIPQSKGKMFLADERGLNQLDWYRSYNTFNFGNYQFEHKEPFSDLYVLNDDTLLGGKSINMRVEEHSAVILIPVVGAIEYLDNCGNTAIIEPGHIHVLNMAAGSDFRIINPYEEELVNFLQLWIKTDEPNRQEFGIDLIHNKNHLIKIFEQGNTIGYLGQFDGRAEAVLPVRNPGNNLFAFVIDGAFEVQYRLMHTRDGLVLWGVNEAELEALSNNAVIMLLEIGGVTHHKQHVG